MNLNKLKDNSGSAMVLVIFIVAIIIIVMLSFSVQVGNQVKSTIKVDKDIEEKYNSEAEIEKEIAKFIEGIKITLKDDIKTSGYITNEYGNKEKVYDVKCLYYEITYNVDSKLNVKDENGRGISSPLKMFIKTDQSVENPDLKDFDFDSVVDVKFNVTIKEANSLKSEILILVSNIKQNDEAVTYDINYSVLSWRSK